MKTIWIGLLSVFIATSAFAESADEAFKKASELVDQGDLAGAQEALRAGLKLREDGHAYYELAKILLKTKGDISFVRQYLKSATELLSGQEAIDSAAALAKVDGEIIPQVRGVIMKMLTAEYAAQMLETSDEGQSIRYCSLFNYSNLRIGKEGEVMGEVGVRYNEKRRDAGGRWERDNDIDPASTKTRWENGTLNLTPSGYGDVRKIVRIVFEGGKLRPQYSSLETKGRHYQTFLLKKGEASALCD